MTQYTAAQAVRDSKIKVRGVYDNAPRINCPCCEGDGGNLEVRDELNPSTGKWFIRFICHTSRCSGEKIHQWFMDNVPSYRKAFSYGDDIDVDVISAGLVKLVTAQSQVVDLEEFAARYGLTWADYESLGCSLVEHSFQELGRHPSIKYPLIGKRGAGNKVRSVERIEEKEGKYKRAARHKPAGGFTGFFPPCNLPPNGEPVYLNGGEDKAVAMHKAGKRALSASAGENITQEFAEFLVGAGNLHFVLTFDGDEAGQKKTESSAANLYAAGAESVGFIPMPDGEDINDVCKRLSPQEFEAFLNNVVQITQVLEPFLLTEVTKKDLMSMEFPPIEWIVEGFIPQGVTLIAAPPKEGKTFFCEYLCDCMGGGRKWGEIPTKKQRVLYIDAEQDEQLIQHRFKALGLENTESDLVFAPMPGFMFSESPGKNIDRLTSQVVGRFDLIVFDTFGRLFELPKSGGDAYETARQRIQPLHLWAKKNKLNVFVVHHTNKVNGKQTEDMDVMELITGSNALLSVVDAGLVIRNHRDNEYKAHIKGRYFPGGTHSLTYDDARWEYKGKFIESCATEERKEIHDAVKALGGASVSVSEIASYTGKKRDNVAHLLKKMTAGKDPVLIRTGNAKKYLYSLPE